MNERPPENDPLAPLSKRERMIAERFATGLTYRQIGAELFIAPTTVRTHIAAIYRKLEIGSKAALVRLHADHTYAATQTTEAGEPGRPARFDATPAGVAAHFEPKTAPGRRQITVLVGGFRDFLRLSEGLDPEDLSRRLAGYERVLRAVARRCDGYTNGLAGGSIRIYFGYPAAHEDDAERAVRCGLALISEVAEHSARCDAPLRLAVGVATGQIVVEDIEVDHAHPEKAIIGAAPHLAAYLRDKAVADALLVAASTKSLLGQAFDFEELPTPETMAFRILSERKTESRFEARSGASLLPMVGRDQELALLLERWARAKAGEGQGVLLVGEAGIGKSRIARALLDAIAEEPHTRIRYQCSPYHADSAFWPVIQQLTHRAGLASADPPDAKLDKLEALLDRAGDQTLGAAPLIADLLGMDGTPRYGRLNLAPQVQRARTLAALVDQLLGLATRQPVLVVLEDAHWIDPTTLELMEQCLGRITAARALILLTARPDNPPRITAHPHVTCLTLNRLGRAGVEAIVARLGGGDLPGEVIETIIARTDGVPLFVEELTKAVLETGETSVPASLHDSLMARLDRLGPMKEIAQIAAVIGREFSHQLIAAISPLSEPDLTASLTQLVQAGLIFRRDAMSDQAYTFKHALVREAAYESLLMALRQKLHARVADTLEDEREAMAEAEFIAHHLTCAGLTERAIAKWLAAGRRTLAQLALQESEAHLTTALALAERLPTGPQRDRLELDVRVAMAGTHFASKGWAAMEVRDVLEPARALCDRCGDVGSRMLVSWYLCLHHFVRCQTVQMLETLSAMLHASESSGDPSFCVAAHSQASCAHAFAGNFSDARRHADALEDGYAFERDSGLALVLNHEPKGWSLTWMAFVYWAEGDIGMARSAVAEQLELARTLDLPWNTIWALTGGSDALSFMGDGEGHLEQIAQARKIAIEQGADFVVNAVCACHEGIARVELGDYELGYEVLTSGTALWNRSGGTAQNPMLNTLRASALIGMNRTDEAINLLQDTIAFVDTTGHKTWWPEPYRLLGRACWANHAAKTSTHWFMEAIERSKMMGARSYELRSARDLANLWAEQGERQKARDLLAPVYDGFTEGFDTADLKQAKALLEQLD